MPIEIPHWVEASLEPELLALPSAAPVLYGVFAALSLCSAPLPRRFGQPTCPCGQNKGERREIQALPPTVPAKM